MKIYALFSVFCLLLTLNLIVANPNYPLSNLNIVATTLTSAVYIVPQHNTEFYVPLGSNFTVQGFLTGTKCKLNNKLLLTFIINDNKVSYFPPNAKIWPETNITYSCGSNGKYSYVSTSDSAFVENSLVLFATGIVIQSYDNVRQIKNPYTLLSGGSNNPSGISLGGLANFEIITGAFSYHEFSRVDLDHLTDNSLVKQTPYKEAYPVPYPVSTMLNYFDSFVYQTLTQNVAPAIIASNANLWAPNANYEVYFYDNYTGSTSIQAYALLGDFSIGDDFQIVGLYEFDAIPSGSRIYLKVNQDLYLPHNIPGYQHWYNKYMIDLEFDKYGRVQYYQSFVNFLPAIILSDPSVQAIPARTPAQICTIIMATCTSNVILTQYQAGSGFPTAGAGQYPNQYSQQAGLNLVGGQQYASQEACVAYMSSIPVNSPPTTPNFGENLQCKSWHASIAQGDPNTPGSGDSQLHCLHTGQINLGPTVTPCQNN